MTLTNLSEFIVFWGSRTTRPQYGSCPSICSSIRPSVT